MNRETASGAPELLAEEGLILQQQDQFFAVPDIDRLKAALS
jgi:hypothetical protein